MGKIISKIILVVLNIVYFLAAVAVLTIGSLSLSGSTVIIDILDLIESTVFLQHIVDVQELTLNASIYLVCLGSVAVVLAFIGTCGTLRGRGWVLVCYGVAKFVIILFNLALIMYNSIVPFHGKDNIQKLMLDNLVINYEPTTFNGNRDVILPAENSSAFYWATMEFNEACCAAGNYTDYEKVNVTVSVSCCMQKQQYKVPSHDGEFAGLNDCLASPPLYTNSRGCIDYVMSVIINYRQIYILTAAVFIALEVLTIALTVRVHGDRDKVRAI